MYVTLDRLLTKKIYYDLDLVLRHNTGDNKVSVVFSDGLLEDEFQNLFDQIHYLPNTTKNIYFPAKYFSLVSGAEVNKTKEKNDFFKELKAKKIKAVFHRIDELGSLNFTKSPKTTTPLIVNLSKVQSDIADYLSKHRKTNIDAFTFTHNNLNLYFAKDLPKDYKGKKVFFFVINQPTDTFVKFFDFGIRKEFAKLKALFSNSTVIIINPGNKLFLNLDLKNDKVNISTANLLNKFTQVIAKFDKNKVAEYGDIEVLKSDLGKEEVSELPKIEDHEEYVEPVELNGSNTPDKLNAKNIQDINDIKNKQEESDSNDSLNVKSTAEVSDIDFNEITGSAAISEIDKVRQDNEDFLKRMKPYQDKALADIEKEAARVNTDNHLDPTVCNDKTILSEKVRSSSLNSISTSYYKKQHLTDQLNIFKSLANDPDYPVAITKYERTNTSDSLNLKEEVSVQFLDKKGKRHTFTVDVPILSHDGYLYYNGTKKVITKQATLLPIIKESNDRVQITTNYRKSFIYRKGDKINITVDKILRLLVSKEFPQIKKVSGNNKASNLAYNISIAYNFLATKFYTVKIGNVLTLQLNQTKFREKLGEKKIEIDYNKYIPIGIDGMENIIIEEISSRKIFSYASKGKKVSAQLAGNITEYLEGVILSLNNKEISESYSDLSSTKSLAFTEIKIASIGLPVGVLISFFKGLRDGLDLYKVKYSIEEKRRRPLPNETLLSFKDVNLYVNSEGNAAKELYINGLSHLNSRDFEIKDSDRLGLMYLEYFNDYTGSRNNAKALMNFESSMIDPITLEILKELKLPETFAELILYGNDMLSNYTKKRKNDSSNFRLRGSEVINVALYNTLINSFNNYKRTAKTGVVASISPNSKEAVMKELSNNPNIEGYSQLSPFYEIEAMAKTSFKGPSGLNSDDAYTAEIRAYDPSMLGLYGYFTPVSAAVGVNRSLVMNPKVKNTRGYLDDSFDLDKSDQTNLLSFGELVNGFNSSHSDPMRICMSTTQSRHIVPTKVSNPYLIGTGADKSLAHVVGQDFCWKASEDGVIESIDAKNHLVFVKYSNGVRTAIDTEVKPAFNQGSGFYTINTLELLKKYKVGSKFKKGDIIAANEGYFKEMSDVGSFGFCPGKLTKVAMMNLDNTFEDSGVISTALSNDMASEIVSGREVVLRQNTRLIKIAKVGDQVETNTPLIVFEEVGENEKEALAALDKLSKTDSDTISKLARSIAKAKYAGTIVAMDVHYNVEVEELHPTLRSFIQEYIGKYDKKAKSLSGIKSDELITIPNTKKVNSEKILGNEMQGVLITYYIKHLEPLDVGSKVTFFSSCKTIVSEVIPEGQEPYSEHRPEESIDAFLPPMSLISRMIMDVPILGWSNKILLELKKQVIEDLDL